MSSSSHPMVGVATPRRVRRYLIGEEIARGGTGVVHLARQLGDRGFSRLVAVKVLRPECATDVLLTESLAREARLSARIRHVNVVQTLDVVAEAGELIVVMEYVHGVSLARLMREALHHGEGLPCSIAAAIVGDLLLGLDAAHEARDEHGRKLAIVHRDVSPQNILVGADGLARLADFGIAKALQPDQDATAPGLISGKLSYMAPEQRLGLPLTRRADIFAAGVVLGVALGGTRPPQDVDGAKAWRREVIARLWPPLAKVVERATRDDERDRYGSAAEMAAALARSVRPATKRDVQRAVAALAGDALALRSAKVAELEKLDEPDAQASSAGPAIIASAVDPPLARARRARTTNVARRRKHAVLIAAPLLLAAASVFALPSTKGSAYAPPPAGSVRAQSPAERLHEERLHEERLHEETTFERAGSTHGADHHLDPADVLRASHTCDNAGRSLRAVPTRPGTSAAPRRCGGPAR